MTKVDMDEVKSLELIVEAVRYCQRVAEMGMPSSCYTKALREPIYFLWTCRVGRNKAARAEFRSKATIGLSCGKGEVIFDHAIPFKYLQGELLKLSEVSTDTVRLVLNKFHGHVLITREENQRLNQAGLRSAMPKNWDGTDQFARYRAVGIEWVPNVASDRASRVPSKTTPL